MVRVKLMYIFYALYERQTQEIITFSCIYKH